MGRPAYRVQGFESLFERFEMDQTGIGKGRLGFPLFQAFGQKRFFSVTFHENRPGLVVLGYTQGLIAVSLTAEGGIDDHAEPFFEIFRSHDSHPGVRRLGGAGRVNALFEGGRAGFFRSIGKMCLADRVRTDHMNVIDLCQCFGDGAFPGCGQTANQPQGRPAERLGVAPGQGQVSAGGLRERLLGGVRQPAFLKAKELLKTEDIGDIMFIRARYGHGGRLGYDKEWRAKKAVAGGGEMLDQGCHLIDLGRMFLGDFADVAGYTPLYFWDMEVEDNGFALLRTKKGQVIQLHASWTEWKNLFSFEIMCRTGKIQIDGLGRSYGTETLTFYKMKPEMGVPDKEVFEFKEEDRSWELEFADFIDSIKSGKALYDLDDAHACLKVICKIYAWSEKN